MLFVSRDVRSGESSARLCPEGLFREEWEVLFPHSSPKKQKGEKHTNKELLKAVKTKRLASEIGTAGKSGLLRKSKIPQSTAEEDRSPFASAGRKPGVGLASPHGFFSDLSPGPETLS